MRSSSTDPPATHDAHDQSNAVAVLTCPRCGRVDRMSYQALAAWTGGVRCGLCGPPYVLMEARIVVDGSEGTNTTT